MYLCAVNNILAEIMNKEKMITRLLRHTSHL